MKSDINPPKVENIAVAIVQETNELNEQEWNAYLINLKNNPIEGVIVASKGYGEIKGEKRKTALFRHFLDRVEGNQFKKIESLTKELFALSNEFWVSFFENKQMFDKKYIFLAESIQEENLTTIPLIEKKGVLIK